MQLTRAHRNAYTRAPIPPPQTLEGYEMLVPGRRAAGVKTRLDSPASC